MAQPQITKTKWTPQQGGLAADIDPKDLSGGNLLVNGVNTGGMNIRNVGKGQNVMMDYEPIYGNEYVYRPDGLAEQNKRWRIYADVTGVPAVTGAELIQNGSFGALLADWSVAPAGSWIYNLGVAQRIPSILPGIIAQEITAPYGNYTLTFDFTTITSGTCSVFAIDNGVSISIATINANGSYSFSFDSTPSNSFVLSFVASPSFDGSLDNVSLILNNQLFGFDFTLSSSTGSLFISNSRTFTFTNSISTVLASISSFVTGDFGAYSPLITATEITGSYTGYVEFELTSAPYFDYVLLFDNTFSSNGTSSLIVVQEAIDIGCLGEWNLIGSDDKPSDSFQFWTTRVGLPVELEIFNITNPGGTTVRVETLEPHGLVSDQAVRISNVDPLTEVNGIWTITYVSATEFDLNNCVWIGPTYISGGVVTTNIYGVGEIGVAVKDDQGVISYTRLLRSKEFNFSTLKQIDCRAKRKQDIQKYAVYYTDNFNVPRVFYYKGLYQTDGALNYISSDNIYEYDNISSESRWFANNEDFSISFVKQDQTGGSLKSGNWRYSARFLTSNFTTTNWSILTETVPVFKDATTSYQMIGDNPDVVTSKVNVLKITNNVPGLFTYVEIAALNYFNNLSPQGFIIGRYVLNQNSEQLISHNGNEADELNLDVGSLNDFNPSFVKAQNVELLDNRAILSNLTPSQTIDFSEWVSTFRYSIEREALDPVGVWNADLPNIPDLNASEYMLPDNVYSKKSHMMMETYRYGFMFKLKNGSYTQVFYPGYDIKIDLPSASLYPFERDPGSFTTFDLTDQAGTEPTEVYTIYLKWNNINLSFLIDGIPAYDLIDEIIPCRASVIPEVLLNGFVIKGVSGGMSGVDPTAHGYTGTTIGPYPFVAGEPGFAFGQEIYPGNYAATSWTPEQQSAFFYSADNSFNAVNIDYLSGDKLIHFGAPTRYYQYKWTDLSLDSQYSEFDGYSNTTTNPSFVDINDAKQQIIANGQTPTKTLAPSNISVGGINHSTKLNIAWSGGGGTYYYYYDNCIICRLSTTIGNTGPNFDFGLLRAIYYRPLQDKYGNPESTKYEYQLEPYVIGDERTLLSNDFKSYGDVFNQKTYLKFRPAGWWDRLSPGAWDGYGSCLSYYSQNRNNIQLRCLPTDDFDETKVIQKLSRSTWTRFGFSDGGTVAFTNEGDLYVPKGKGRDSQLFYNTGYTPYNGVTSVPSFNSLLEYQTDWGNAIAWSNPESDGSNTDNLRSFPPLNLKFLDYTQGPITDARVLNGELVTVQSKEVQRQYFDSTAVLTTQNGGEAYLGTGAVLSRRGSSINKFGSRHKWSIILGLSDKGNDVLYGIDDINNTVWRLGYDGTNSLDEIQGMKSFFANNLSWIRGKYTPANDEGIRGVANQRYREIIWTLRGRKQFDEWQAEDNFCQQFSFVSNEGNELVFAGNFASTGSLTGWDSLDGTFPYAANGTWQMQYLFAIPGYAANKDGTGEGYLTQSNPIPFVVGSTYVVRINVPIAPTLPIDISFQLGGPVAYSISAAGNYVFNYTAVSGDDNICIYSPLLSDAVVTFVSIKESLQDSNNWNGSGNWVISNNEACTVGSTSSQLVQNTSNYILPNYPYTLTFVVSSYTSGDLRVQIGNVTSGPIGISGIGTYTIGVSPTATGVISFKPSTSFEGCIKGNIKICTTGVLKVYNTGDIVQTSGYGGIMATWSQTPDIWVCLKDNVTSNPYTPPDPDDPDWELIPHTNPDYYTEYTIVYNELKNKFQTFMTILPKIYAHFQNGYLVPKPISDTGRVYQSDTGIPTTWFETNTGDAYLDAVINSPAGRKRYLAARVESDVAPTTMDVTTLGGSSTTTAGEFEQREGNEFDGYVKDTPSESILQGDFGIFRFTFAAGTYNRLNSFIASVRDRARKWFR